MSSKNMQVDSGLFACRICKSFAGARNDLIESPCLCKGSMGYVHFTCLERWLNQTSRNYCELCLSQLPASCHRRYGLLRSLFIWVSNPINRTNICYDLIIMVILTSLTGIIISISLVGAGVFSDEPRSLQDPFVRGVILLFMFILLASYVSTLYLILQDHVKPWYTWWRHCVNVRLHLDPSKLPRPTLQPNTSKIYSALASSTVIENHSTEMLTLLNSTSSNHLSDGKTTMTTDPLHTQTKSEHYLTEYALTLKPV